MRYSGFRDSRSLLHFAGRTIASLGVLATLPGFAADLAARGDEVPFRLVHDFAVIVPVTVNGRGPYSFLLDTGSSRTSIDAALAGELHLAAAPGGSVITVTGSQPVEVAQVRSLAAGTITFAVTEVLVRDLRGLRDLDRSLHGVLGQDALRQTDYLLDYRHRVLRFDENGELLRSLDGERMTLTPVDAADASSPAQYGSTLVESKVGDDRRKLVLDSGSASLVLFGQALPPGSAFVTGDVRDDYGRRGEARVEKVRLCIGRACQQVAAWSVAGSVFPGIDGLLPTWLFASVYVSNSSGFTMLAPRRRPPLPEDVASLKIGIASGGGR